VLRVSGGVRRSTTKHPAILNVEKVEVVSVEPEYKHANPECKRCGSRMSSEGRGQGFECHKCGARGRDLKKVVTSVDRGIYPGIYLPSPGAQRHLTKQLIRYGREVYSARPMISGWLEQTTVRPLRVPAQNPR
jgi:tRNA(Ile2)-agmatinylcytidine synthase